MSTPRKKRGKMGFKYGRNSLMLGHSTYEHEVKDRISRKTSLIKGEIPADKKLSLLKFLVYGR